MDNMNIRKINGFTVQLVADGVYAIDEFGIALMYLIIGKTQALLLDTGVGAGNVHAVVKELTDLPCLVVTPTIIMTMRAAMSGLMRFMHIKMRSAF